MRLSHNWFPEVSRLHCGQLSDQNVAFMPHSGLVSGSKLGLDTPRVGDMRQPRMRSFLPAIMEMALATGPRAAAGREQRLRFQGLAAGRSLRGEPHPCAIVPASAAAAPHRWFPAVASTASCPRASLVACSYKHRVRWSGLKSRGLIPAPVIAVNAFRSRAVPDNSSPAGNGERRPPWRCLAPIRPPLFLSHAMKGDGVFQPGQGTTRPEGVNASRSKHRQRAKTGDTTNGPRPGTRAGTGQEMEMEMETRHRPGGARRSGRAPLTQAAFRRANLPPRTAFRPRHLRPDPPWTPSSARTGSRPASEGPAG